MLVFFSRPDHGTIKQINRIQNIFKSTISENMSFGFFQLTFFFCCLDLDCRIRMRWILWKDWEWGVREEQQKAEEVNKHWRTQLEHWGTQEHGGLGGQIHTLTDRAHSKESRIKLQYTLNTVFPVKEEFQLLWNEVFTCFFFPGVYL